MSTSAKSKKLWIVIRVVDYRLQAMAMEDGTPQWEDIGPETYVTDDGEEAFQLATKNRGLKLSANGLPSARKMKGYHECLAMMIGAQASAGAREAAKLDDAPADAIDGDELPAEASPY